MIQHLVAVLLSRRLLTVGLLLFVEELGIPFVVPGDFLMVAAGVLVAQHRVTLWQVLLVEESATLAGASLLYLFAGRVGRPLFERYGRYVGLREEHLPRAEARLRRHGFLTVLVGRLTPGLRMIVVAAAGVVGIPAVAFVPAVIIGASLYLLGYTLVGMVFGPPAVVLITRLAIPSTTLLSLFALALIAVAIHALRGSAAARSAMRGSAATYLVGGLLAGLAAVVSGNVVFGAIAVASQASGHALPFAVVSGRGLPVLLTWPAFLLTASLVATLYAYSDLHRWPLGTRLAATTLIPLVLTLALLEPTTDLRGNELSAAASLLAAAATTMRWLVFGAVLATLPSPAAPVRGPQGGTP